MHRLAPKIAPADSPLVDLLMQPDAYPHAVNTVELIETHISWVLLAGDFVYKIKKPVKLDFLDFHSLERRHFYCEEEIRLNKPWTPDVYIDVVPITLSEDKAHVGGSGPPVEYAVRMRRFDQTLRLDAQLASGNLSVADIREIASVLATRHQTAPAVEQKNRTRAVRRAIEMIRENFGPLRGAIEESQLKQLHDWTEQQLRHLEQFLLQRFDDGFFRECHGDLHLGNLVRLPGGIATFDCIEFNDDLRNIDVMADIAFLIMDLVASQRADLAAHLINRYLEVTGDYGGMRVFNLYFTYRCLVRAKIAVIRSQERRQARYRQEDLAEAHQYCDFAQRQFTQRTPVLVIMTGLSGSGKTWISGELMAALPAIRVRSDIERKRRFDLGETADSQSGIATGIYSGDVSSAVYAQLNTVAETLLAAGHNVILDACFLQTAERSAAMNVARRAEAHSLLLHVHADESLLRKRVLARQKQNRDASEADTNVLEFQLQHYEPLTDDEQQRTIQCKSNKFDAADLAERIRNVSNVA